MGMFTFVLVSQREEMGNSAFADHLFNSSDVKSWFAMQRGVGQKSGISSDVDGCVE